MLIPIATILEHPLNARRVSASDGADAALIASMRTLGLIQPIIVAPIIDSAFAEVDEVVPAQWELRAGARRLRAAKALGWTAIQAVELTAKGDETAISAAENMVRAAMHPVDQWRAIRDLRAACGYSLDTAAAAIGVAPAMAKRMEWLGAMAEPVLDAMGESDLPMASYLRAIAFASHDTQLTALERARISAGGIDWRIMAEHCTTRRIPRERAVFDPALIAWDEDLFAEPEDDARFTTADVDGFMTHQRAAFAALLTKHKGRWIEYTQDPSSYNPSLPKGWTIDYSPIPKRFAKDDPRKVFATLSARHHNFGEIDLTLAYPSRPRASAASAQTSETAPTPKSEIAKRTLQQLARLKAEAVRSRLLELADQGPSVMLEALLLMFTFRNVQAGGIAGSASGTIARIVSPEGAVRDDVDDAALCRAAAWLIGAVIAFDAPDNFRASGPGAEWLATTIGAEMPRTDTEEILAGINGDALRRIAIQHNLSTKGSVSALRARLAGQLADWRAVTFGAPGPEPRDDSQPAITWPDEDQEDAT